MTPLQAWAVIAIWYACCLAGFLVGYFYEQKRRK